MIEESLRRIVREFQSDDDMGSSMDNTGSGGSSSSEDESEQSGFMKGFTRDGEYSIGDHLKDVFDSLSGAGRAGYSYSGSGGSTKGNPYDKAFSNASDQQRQKIIKGNPEVFGKIKQN